MMFANFDFCNPNLFSVNMCLWISFLCEYVCIDAVNELELYNNNVTGFLDQIPYLIGANFV